MFLRRALLVALLVGAANAAAACGDTTGEPIYQNSQAEPVEGVGGTGPGDPNNHRDCPKDVPDDKARCQLRDQIICRYGDGTVECDCNQNNWDCDYRCPAQVPEGSCLIEGKACDYPGRFCFCEAEGGWECVPSMCPLEPPEPGTPCPDDTAECPYSHMLNCSCDHGTWNC